MHAYMRRGLQVALLVGGGALFAAPAYADDSTSGQDSLLGGNQIVAEITAPVTAAGNAVSGIGDSTSKKASTHVASGSGSSGGSGSSSHTSGKDSAGGGNQAKAPVSAPVTVSGNAVSVVGDSHSKKSGAQVSSGGSSGSSSHTSGKDSAGGGNQAKAPVSAPVTVSGNAVSVVGDSHSKKSGAHASSGSTEGGSTEGASTSGEDSVLGGNQVTSPVTIPVTVSGNSVSVIGDSHAQGSDTAVSSGSGSSGADTTSGEDSVGGGNQVTSPVTIPVTVSGNAISVIGDSHSENATTDSTSTSGSGTGTEGNSTTGEDSVLGGNQLNLPVNVPVTIGGNAISVVGDSHSEGATTDSTSTSGSGTGTEGNSTTGEDAIGGGNQVTSPVNLPVTIGGNAISGIGDSHTEDATTTVDSTTGSTGGDTTSGEDSVLGGNQLNLPIDAPITIGGNAGSVVGDSTTEGSTTDVTTPGGENPGGENPGGENPGGDNPGGENPGGEEPMGSTPTGVESVDYPAAVSPAALVSGSPVAEAGMPSTLARTGTEAGALLQSALLLLLVGGLLVAVTRRRERVTV